MTIPKKIFQTCADVQALKPEILANIEKIKALNPGWSYALFDDQAMWAYFEANFDSSIMGLLKGVNPKYGVVLADLFRYLVIYNEGGVYLDIKSTMGMPLDKVLREEDELVLSQWRNRMGEEFVGAGLYPELNRIPGGEFQQWHVIAKAGHPLLMHVVNEVLLNIKNYSPHWFGVGKVGVLRLSGPICYSLCLAPHLAKHPIRFADIQTMGFSYSLYKQLGDKDFHTKSLTHYSALKEPIVSIRPDTNGVTV